MKLMDKVKSLFTEEVEVEEELPKTSKREKTVDIELPKREEVKFESREKQVISDAPALTREERPKTPIYFDDKAFDDLLATDPPKREEKHVSKNEFSKKSLEDAYKGNTKKEEAKVFKPSPIISPVYGVLDRNYHKDDIKANDLEKPTVAVKKNTAMTVDDIRNKAFGTLEDDLENNFLNSSLLEEDYNEDITDDTDDTSDGLDIFEGLNTREARNAKVDLLREDYQKSNNKEKEDDISAEIAKQKQKINEINEYIKNTKATKNGSPENNMLEEEQTNEEPVVLKKVDDSKEDDDKSFDNIEDTEEDNTNDGVESELFDLIDSMYEKRDEK